MITSGAAKLYAARDEESQRPPLTEIPAHYHDHQRRGQALRRPGRAITRTTTNRNYKLKKSHLFTECRLIWLNNLQFLERKRSNFAI
jgi:hypothetical protein